MKKLGESNGYVMGRNDDGTIDMDLPGNQTQRFDRRHGIKYSITTPPQLTEPTTTNSATKRFTHWRKQLFQR